MEKYRIFSIVMSSMLILSTASTTLVAVAENVDDSTVQKDSYEGEQIKQIFHDITTLKYDLSDLSDEQVAALNGFIDGTYNLQSTVDENTTYITLDEIDDEADQLEGQEVLTFVSSEDSEKTAYISLTELLELTFLSEEEIPVTENEGVAADETVIEESVEPADETVVEESVESVEETADVIKDNDLPDSQSEEKETVQDAVEDETITEENDNLLKKEDTEEIPEAFYTPKDYSDSDDTSYSRAYEVDELLHGSETQVSTFGTMMFRSASTRVADSSGLYTVKSGDTFNAIASSFNFSTRQLSEWNGHVSDINNLVVGTKLAVTRRGVETLLSDSDKARLYRGGAQPVFTLPQEFIDDIAMRAIEVSNQEGKEALWPSLMIAQAAHESNYGRSSLASPPYHNLSGIKGSHNGKSVLMWTWEVLGGVRVDVLAPFRHYPSYDASLESYASLLRNGLSWSRQYYSGTWRSNTNSVWDVLDNGGLKGYATDPNYFAALRRIINQFDLTKYDTGNYYVRTGTFLGEDFTQQQINKLAAGNSSLSYKMEVDTEKAPYAYRRIQSTQEFLGEAGAQRVIDQLRRDKGWGASMIATGNGTERHRVRSGFFNTRARAETALQNFRNLSGYSASIEHGSDGKYRIITGFFNGASSARQGLNYMHELGWGASIIATGTYTPHYVVRTGTFNTPNHVNSAEVYFNSNGWGSNQVLTSQNNHYYRIFVDGFHFAGQAEKYVSHLSQTYNWGSTAFPVHK